MRIVWTPAADLEQISDFLCEQNAPTRTMALAH
jgi:hypothetical protein